MSVLNPVSVPFQGASFSVNPVTPNFVNSMGPSGADDANPGMKALNPVANSADQNLPPTTPDSSMPNTVNNSNMGSFAQTQTPPELQQQPVQQNQPSAFENVLQQQGQQQQQTTQPNQEQTPGNSPDLDVLLNAIGQREGGGNVDYQMVQGTGPDATYGKYQIKGSMIAALTQQLFGQPMTPQEFLANPQAQDAVARAQLEQALQAGGGNAQNAIAIWFSGKPLSEGNMMDSNNVPLSQYVDEVMNLAQQQTPQQ